MTIRHLLWIVVACVLVYSNTLDNGLHLDDAYRVENNPGVQEFWPPWRHFVDPTTSSALPRIVQYRPLLPLSLSIHHALAGGHSMVSYHVGNLLFHLLASVLLYFLVREILDHWTKDDVPSSASLFAALLFAVHPVGGFLVNYVCSRDLLLMQMFLVGSLLTYARMRRLGENGRRWTGCLLLVLLSLMSKKNAVAIPAVVILFELLVARQSYRDPRVWLRVGVFVALVGAFLLFVRFGLGFSDFENVVNRPDRVTYMLGEMQHHVFHYVRNFFWPFLIRVAPLQPHVTWQIIVGGVCIVASFVFAAVFWRRWPLLVFCVLAYQALIALTSSVFPLFDEVVGYRPYPASGFFWLGFVVLLFHGLRRTPDVVRWILCGLVVYLGWASFVLNRNWKDDQTLWGHSVAHGGAALAHLNYAQSLPTDDTEKRHHYEEALKLAPDYIVAHINLGLMQIRLGERDADGGSAGLKRVLHAVALNPAIAQSQHWLGEAYWKLGMTNEAADAAAEACRLLPHNEPYRYNAGHYASVAGRHVEVLRILEPLLSRRPDFGDIQFFAGFAHQQLGNRPEAIRIYKEFLARRAGHAGAWYNLGWAYRRDGDWKAAVGAFSQCVAKDPNHKDGEAALEFCRKRL